MYPWRKILVPTDFSTAAQWVFDDAVRLAASTGAEILVVHVRITRGSSDKLRFPADDSVYEYAESQELELLRERMQKLNANVRTRMIVRKGPDPADEIQQLVEEESVDLIVIATHARHLVAQLLVGSTTTGILKGCSVPLIAIRYGIRKRDSLTHIATPVEVVGESSAARELIEKIASHENATVRLLTPERQFSLGDLPPFFRSARVSVEVVNEKKIEKRAIKYVESNPTDLLVIDSDCRVSGELDSSVEWIVRHANAPVLVVPSA